MAASPGELLYAEIKSARYYAAPDLALRDIELSIVPGKFVVVTGPAQLSGGRLVVSAILVICGLLIAATGRRPG